MSVEPPRSVRVGGAIREESDRNRCADKGKQRPWVIYGVNKDHKAYRLTGPPNESYGKCDHGSKHEGCDRYLKDREPDAAQNEIADQSHSASPT